MSPFRRFLVAILALGLAYGAYALLIAPLLEPPPLSLTEGGGTPSVYVATAQLRDFSWLFVERSWELDNPKVVETAQCTLLLKDYKPLPDGRMELNPCTLIFYMAEEADGKKNGLSSGQRRPVVLRAPQGAVLQFDRPLDFSRAEFGTLIGGRLNGDIQIFSPPSVVGGNDALNITTRNVQIDRQKVYTPHEVVFDYGSSFGRGRDLTINLLPKNEEDPNSDRSPSLGGISYLQLAHVERLHLEGAGGMLAGPAGKTPASSSSAPKDPPLEVHCTGPLVVDFEKRRAALDENVEISRVYPQGPADRLTCDRLIFLLVDSKQGKKPTATTSIDTKVPPPDRLSEQVKQIVALGNPVVLDAPQTATYARAGRVDYFTAEKTIKLQGGERQVPVSLKHQEHRFDAREIEYVMAPEGRLGRLWASGPGELEFVQGEAQKKQTIQASWRKTLLVRPQEKYQVISLTQDARVAADGMGEFQAQELHFWVQEVPRQPVGSSGAIAPPQGAAAGSKRPQAKFDIIPDRLLALGQVRIDSPQLKAKTSRLEAWFGEKLEVAATTTVPVEGRNQDEVAVAPAPSSNSLAGAGNPEEGPPLADEQNPPPAAVQKLDVSGDLIQLQFLRVGTKPTIEDLAITGRVEVEEIQTQKPDEVPLKLSGDAVTLVRASGMNAKLEVTGKPARVSARGLSLAGGKIHLHRGENRVWIDGPGEATLPMPAEDLQNRSITAPSDIPALESLDGVDPKKVNVSWTGAMNFDGLTVSFETGVKVRGDGLTANARTMSVTLSQRIDFAAPRQEEPVEVARLALNGEGEMVSIQQIGRDKLTGDQSSLDNLLVRNLVIDRQQGTLKAEGPGEVWTVRRDEAGLPGSELVPGATPKANGKLTYVCVKFEGGIVGNMERHEIKFERQVETTYGQVTDWKDRIIAKRLEDLGESGALVHSDTLTITEMAISKTQKWVELDARGNTLVEGKAFTARAARIGYTSDKDQLILEGDGRSDAELWHQPSPGAQHSYTAAGKIRYHRKSNSLEVDDAKILDLGSLPAGNKPVPVRR